MKNELPKIDSQDGQFHNGNPATGEQGTRVTDVWLNNVQDRLRDFHAELKYVLSKAKLTPIETKTTQVYDAILAIINANRNTASTTKSGEVRLDSSVNSTAEDRAATPKLVKDSITKNTQFVKIHLSGAKSLSVDLTKREEIKSVLLGDNFNSDNFVHYQVTSPNGRNHNITNLPISDKSPVMLDFVIVGAYSLFKAHYVNLNRSFFCNVNWNNETLALNWVEEINGTKRSDSVTSDSSDTVATSKAVKSANDNANGRVSKSGDTITGTLAIKSDYWRKFRLISKDASSWWVETPPNAAESRRVTFCHVTPATDTTAEIVKNIYFPAITQNETVAYQSWVKNYSFSKSRFAHRYYGSHYKGAEVYDIPISDTGGLRIIVMQAQIVNTVEILLPEGFSGFCIPTVTDVGEGRRDLGVHIIEKNKLRIFNSDQTTIQIHVMGWADF